jgi:hypothetical protein
MNFQRTFVWNVNHSSFLHLPERVVSLTFEKLNKYQKRLLSEQGTEKKWLQDVTCYS